MVHPEYTQRIHNFLEAIWREDVRLDFYLACVLFFNIAPIPSSMMILTLDSPEKDKEEEDSTKESKQG